ncbi:MAG: zinc-dependent alcohol dehydrogenase [Anaerolineae bacterium]
MTTYSGKAVAFVRPRRAELCTDVLFPEMDEYGVVIKTEYSTISRGTELDLYTGQMHGRGERAQWYPMLPGYMPAGEVIAVGERITHLKVGDRAVASNLFSGFDERYCCAWGGHCEYTVVSKQSHPALGGARAVRIPDGVPTMYATLAVLGAVALHGVEEKVKPQRGETVLVVGQGVIGNFAAQLCKLAGARVIVADAVERRLQVARQFADAVIAGDALGKEFGGQVLEATSGQGPDKIMEVTGEPRILERMLTIVRPHGLVHAQGMYLEPISIYIPETLFGRNLSLTATVGENPEHVAEVLALMAERKLTYEPLISRQMGVEEATSAYELVHDYPEEVVTVSLKW